MQDELRAKQLAWLDWLKEKTGKSLFALAKDAGRSHNLLSRKVADGGLLNTATVQLLMESTGLPGPDTYLLPTTGLREEATPYVASSSVDPVLALMIAGALKDRPNAAPWRLRTDALESDGYLEGDIIITDASVQPRAGDVVCAQVYDVRAGAAETIFRTFEPPFLISRSRDPNLRKPLQVDDRSVIIMGTVTQSFRTRTP